jgi:peroxiredoxin Q/BCP
MKLRPILALMALSSLFAGFARGEPLKVGDAAPVVTATTDAGTTISLGDVYAKNTYTLVYFYPKADTPGCTKQGCSLRDGYESLTKEGVAVIGVSHDDVAAQKAFKEKYNFPFTLIADHDGAVIKAFGVPTYPAVGMAHRQAYLIKDGKIIYTDYTGTTDKQAETILKVLAEQKK